MSRFLRWTLAGLATIATISALAVAAASFWLQGSLPQTEGRMELAGPHAPIEIFRDARGIPTIRAGNDHDAYFALGFVHAQDRLWQMDFMRRSGAGRLSEVAGEATLRIDRFMRVLGLYRVAEANYANLAGPARDAIDAYTAGVNAFLDNRDGPLPLEFQLLRYAPEPWRPADSVVWGRLMALQLSGNWNEEALRARLSQVLTAEQIDQLWPAYPDDAPVTLDGHERAAGVGRNWERQGAIDPALLQRHDAALAELTTLLPWALAPKSASNAWVLDGRHTESGKPLLANDPHLALNAPGLWYLARIETPDWLLAGATAPGVPFLVAGHNGHVAWGLTTTQSDTQDLFIERLSAAEQPDGPTLHETPNGSARVTEREEVIAVRGGDPDLLTVRETKRGPLLSDVVVSVEEVLEDSTALALAWPALDPADRTALALFEMNHAKSAADFKRAALAFDSPQQSIVYADTDGDIGFIAPAKVPIRRQGNGLYPAPGWLDAHDWIGTIPAEELPAGEAPASGRFVAANNKPVSDDYPYLLTSDWPDHHRARRIVQMLDEGDSATVEGAQAMQLDDLSLAAGELLPIMLAAPASDSRAAQAIALLRDWDQRMSRDAPQPLIFTAWMQALNTAVMADELGRLFPEFQRGNASRLLTLLRDHPQWCDDRSTETVAEDCNERIALALDQALAMLSNRFGNDMAAWRWGDAHVARFEHALLDRIPFIGGLFNFGLEVSGGNDTVNRAGARFTGPAESLFEDVHGPGYRAVYDLADLDNSRFMIATGQSGNPLSPHYGDLAEDWRDGKYLKLVAPTPSQTNQLVLSPLGR